ncbi:hypothetical protein [Pelotalea chapellei]|uniref:Uncharacterized protein n=1 Tax=Pelotalea chapellei TaxID=44671 RepID=A0ABS5U909_9BACT|nr:hypothetical protein [Pelotalea chapellei]MBT1072125.1 hypothetical protein [Pelotalea chapellei]
MTEPVIIISGAAPICGSKDKKRPPKEALKKATTHVHSDEAGDDSVDISEEARDCASGRKRRNILEYLNEEIN